MQAIFLADIIVTVIATIWLITACVTDIKKREVADWLSFSLIAIALTIKTITSLLTSKYYYLIYSLFALGIFIFLAFLFYYSKAFGGGDAKLLMAIGACFGTRPLFATTNTTSLGFSEPFLLTFIINLLFIGALYGILFSIILAVKNKKKFLENYKKFNKDNYKIFYFVFSIILFILAFIFKAYNLIILAVIFIILPYVFSLVRASEQLMIKVKGWRELTEGDWLVQEIKIKNKIIKPTADGLTKEDISLIKKANKKVLIRDGLPFVPAFVLALLTSLFIGNLLLLIIV
ncbi:MAG: A24 family peptidase [Candidatus Pacearchaeota archaeon]